ncbi:MAG: ShlB/FhaC/HecB family hemolysin secretion/activation protein [Desulfobacterales bacterium]|nr:ShlB/FhaC/HecB family hemolysin secretion/activation protein [Desulfobacterales bacterium]
MGVVFEGATVFSEDEMRALAEPFIGRMVNVANLEELRHRLTRLYVDNGFLNSGALIKPDQRVDEGVVVFIIIEGRLDEIDVSGVGRLRSEYVTGRLWPDRNQPFNITLLQERFLMLLQDPLIRRMDGRILPGATPGKAALALDVTRERPYGLRLTADNHRPPGSGAEGCVLTGWLHNLTGFGDLLDVSYGISEGVDEFDVAHSVFLFSSNTRFSLHYNYNENSVIEESMKSLDIESESESLDITLMRPIFRTPGLDVELGASLSIRESRTFLLGIPFSFSPGVTDGESRVSVLRLVQSYVDRTPRRALALRSTFNLGLDLFNATMHANGRPDGEYVSWLGQFQYAHRLGKHFGSLILRGDAQLASDELLPLEQFALGGATTVRGYRENELVRDNGFDVSVEWRYPLWDDLSREDSGKQLQLACFMDYGAAWNKGEEARDHRLHSAGLGLLWESKWLKAAVYWAHDIEKVAPKADYDLQDDGVHFQFIFQY